MWIIDRYLLRQFVQTFLICFLSLTGLYIVFDVFSNLDRFLRCGRKAGGVLLFMAQLLPAPLALGLRPHQRDVGHDLGHVHVGLDPTS